MIVWLLPLPCTCCSWVCVVIFSSVSWSCPSHHRSVQAPFHTRYSLQKPLSALTSLSDQWDKAWVCSVKSFTVDSSTDLFITVLIQPRWARDLHPWQIKSLSLSCLEWCISPVALLRFSNIFNYSKHLFRSCLWSICKQKRYFKKNPNNWNRSVILG